MVNIIVKNRSDIFHGFHTGNRSLLISITDPDKGWCPCNILYDTVLGFKFWDSDGNSVDGVDFDSSMAKDILSEVMSVDYDTIVVNCEAGQSRSAGVAAALSLILTGDDNKIIRQKPLYNRYVYRKLLNEHFDKKDAEI